MNSSITNIRRPAFLTVREAAWSLGISPAAVCRLIRIGVLPVVWRRSRVVLPVYTVARLLAEAADTSPPIMTRQVTGGGA